VKKRASREAARAIGSLGRMGLLRRNVERPGRWVIQHGIPRLGLRLAAHSGDLTARYFLGAGGPDARALNGELRSEGGIVPGPFGHFVASHSAARELLRNDDAGVGVPIESYPWIIRKAILMSRDPHSPRANQPPSMGSVNQPDHKRYRSLVSKAFTPRAITSLGSRIDSTSDRLITELAATGPNADLIVSYTSRLPLLIIADILGVPESEAPQLSTHAFAVSNSLETGLPWREFQRVDRALLGFNSWVGQHLNRLRDREGVDVLSNLVRISDEEGNKLTDTELKATAGLLLAAGLMTTATVLADGVELLLTNPDQLRILQNEPDLWPNAVDEIIRLSTPIQLTSRRALQDTEFSGTRLSKDSRVVILLAAANRDPDVFPNPNTFDVRRVNAKDHLAFSSGRHYCLGSSLAKLEAQIGLRKLFERFPALSLDGPPIRDATTTYSGWKSLPVAGLEVPTELSLSHAPVSMGGCPFAGHSADAFALA
jgi:cytochrome P450